MQYVREIESHLMDSKDSINYLYFRLGRLKSILSLLMTFSWVRKEMKSLSKRYKVC